MIRKISADWVFPIATSPLKNGVVTIEKSGKIIAVDAHDQHDPATVEHFKGILTPGFINAHCHLELSHMKGMVETGTTLIPFITNVVTKRNVSPEIIAEKIAQADRDMWENGIVAVGDISNAPDTFAVKSKSPIRYHTFVEMFDFLQEHDAQKTFDQYKAVYDTLKITRKDAKSAVPHAPYSVSKSLFQKIKRLNSRRKPTQSIHLQETKAEMDLFLEGKGGFYDFYSRFGISLEAFRPSKKTPIHYAMKHLDAKNRVLFVHNTLVSAADILVAKNWGGDRVFWATCPNANLYIENRMPNYKFFLEENAQICIGTDSLTSNWQLSILEEMKTIQRFQSYVPFENMLTWATLNGARALGFDDTLGSLEIGKKAGINLIESMESLENGFILGGDAKVRKIV